MPTRSALIAAAAATPSAQAAVAGLARRRVPPRLTFVLHSPGAAMRRVAPITTPAATTSRRSCPTGGISSWTSAPRRWNQGLMRMSSRQRWSSSFVSHSEDVDAPAAVAGLDDQRRFDVRKLTVGPEMLGARMRDPRPGEQAGSEQLVVSGGEGRGRVEDAETAPLEPEKLEETGLDTVDGRKDVEPAEHDVTRLGATHRSPVRADERRVDAECAPGGDDLDVRVARFGTANSNPRGRRRHEARLRSAGPMAGQPRPNGRLEQKQRQERRPLGQPGGIDSLVGRMRALADRAEPVECGREEAGRVRVRAAPDEARVLERQAQLMTESLGGREQSPVTRERFHRRPAEASLDLDRGTLEDGPQASDRPL